MPDTVTGDMITHALYDLGINDQIKDDVRVKALEVLVRAVGMPELWPREYSDDCSSVVIIDDIPEEDVCD